MSTIKNPKVSNLKTVSCTRFNGHIVINGQEPTITTTLQDLPEESSGNHSESPDRKEMIVPQIVIWPDPSVVDDTAINIDGFLQPPSPEDSISSTPQPPLPPTGSVTEPENPYPDAQLDEENEGKHSQNDLNQEEEKNKEHVKMTLFESEIDKNDVNTDGEINVTWSLNDKSNDNGEENVHEEKKHLLDSRQRPLRRQSVSPDSFHLLGKKTLACSQHHSKETLAAGSTGAMKNSASFNPDHPTMGQSLNIIASQTFQENQKIVNEEKGLGADLPFNETKKRRSFCDMLLEIPRKLSQVSEAGEFFSLFISSYVFFFFFFFFYYIYVHIYVYKKRKKKNHEGTRSIMITAEGNGHGD